MMGLVSLGHDGPGIPDGCMEEAWGELGWHAGQLYAALGASNLDLPGHQPRESNKPDPHVCVRVRVRV